MRRHLRALCATAILLLLGASFSAAQTPSPVGVVTLTATDESPVRDADAVVDTWLRTGDLRVVDVVDDTLVSGRRHERLAQFHNGVRVFGADVTRQTDAGVTVSVFGDVYTGLDVDTDPALTADDMPAHLSTRFGLTATNVSASELFILENAAGAFRLVHRTTALAPDGLRVCFVDAQTGDMVWEYEAIRTNNDGLPCDTCRVGEGRGVKGDSKKISVRAMGGEFRAVDLLRPAESTTYDMKGDWERTFDVVFGSDSFLASDIGQDNDNNWNDGAVVDAHVGAGWTYDYLHERFGRRGLDGNDSPIISIVHPVSRSDLFTVPDNIFSLFHLNAFYCGECGPNGLMLYGEGLPAGFVLTSTGQSVDFFSGALDIVSHELAHAVTDHTSQLIYQDESGALNEAFSDIIGVSVEFFMAETGRHRPERADYLLGEDVFKPGAIRSLNDPLSLGDPDHYSIRFLGSDDNGGVHINSLIAGHAFYLAIEGGRNRTSQLTVTGVGSENRAQIEQVFYRAFVMLLPANATFADARAATLQSARDMFGAGHDVERAIREAWTAVGVQ